MKAAATVKKRPHEVRELKVHTAGKGDSLAQLTLGQLSSGCTHMRAKAGFSANDISTGTHAFDVNRRAHSMLQALNLVSRRSMGHRAVIIWIWLEISKMNVQFYTKSMRTCILWCLLTVSNPNVFQNCPEHLKPFSNLVTSPFTPKKLDFR